MLQGKPYRNADHNVGGQGISLAVNKTPKSRVNSSLNVSEEEAKRNYSTYRI